MISVVIPLYNKEQIIERTLKSVLTQDYNDFEVVVVNDGSTDGSVEIVKSISDIHVTLIEQENGGPSKARNTGVKNAKGKWILFLDADDELLPGALKHFDLLTKEHRDISMFVCPYIVDNGKCQIQEYEYKNAIVKNACKEQALVRISPHAGSALIKREFILKNMYNEQIRRYEDLEHLIRLYRDVTVYTDSTPTALLNTGFALASKPRKDIKEDFIGHLSLRGKNFWETMMIYTFFLWERPHYERECRKLYPFLYKRYDLLILYKLIRIFRKYI